MRIFPLSSLPLLSQLWNTHLIFFTFLAFCLWPADHDGINFFFFNADWRIHQRWSPSNFLLRVSTILIALVTIFGGVVSLAMHNETSGTAHLDFAISGYCSQGAREAVSRNEERKIKEKRISRGLSGQGSTTEFWRFRTKRGSYFFRQLRWKTFLFV